MPEPGGLALETASAAVRTLASRIPIVGFGATAIRFEATTEPAAAERTVEAVARLSEAALG
jgi:hypothetical protein